MLIRNAFGLRTRLNSFLARRAFLSTLVRTDGPLVRRQEVISIVDDNLSIRRAVKRLIESAELVVEEFTSAEEFLLSSRSQDSACLILDLRLPGMSGLELLQKLKESEPGVEVILLTAYLRWY